MRIAVLGVGLIGGSIGLAARACVDGAVVTGFARNRERLEYAAELGAIDLAAASLEEAVEGADACFACGPVGALPDQVQSALVAASEDCVVTDVGSTKRRLIETIEDERFVGGHPIAGAETSGVEHARADLFQGAVWYLTPLERSSGLLYERLHRLVVAFGARPVAIDADTHDRLLAAVSHLPHVLANVLVSQAARTLAGGEQPLPRVGPSFRDATRVAGASSSVWTDIYLANRVAIAEEIEETVARLQGVADALRAGEAAAVESWNEQAREDRRRLLEADLAGGAVHELHLTVPNRPGIVAQVALALGKADVNIVDMALAPAPDMRSGAMTLWIAGDDQAARATELIGGLGFPVAEQ
jgi:prephenate dehydrogenase